MFFTPHVAMKSVRGARIVPFAGSTERTSQPYCELLVPLENPVAVAIGALVEPGKTKTKVFVGVGDAVSVASGVEVNV